MQVMNSVVEVMDFVSAHVHKLGVFLFGPKLVGQQDVSWESSEGNLSCASSFQRSKAETVMFVGVFVFCSPSNTLNGKSIAHPRDYSSSQSSKS